MGGPFPIIELQPRAPLVARHRFVVRAPGERPTLQTLAVFETGERLVADPSPAPVLSLESVRPPPADGTSRSSCETGSGQATFVRRH
jgi:hypothetical protein